jgi:hypothetical protein
VGVIGEEFSYKAGNGVPCKGEGETNTHTDKKLK